MDRLVHDLSALLATLAAGLAFSAPAAAQPAPPEPEPPEIIVEGARDRERAVRDYIGALTSGPAGSRIGRFEGPVCVSVVGFSPFQNQAIARRMRQVAETAGVPLGGSGCTPNALVVATRDRETLIRSLRREHPDYFRGVSAWDVRRLAKSDAPAVAWQSEWLLGAELIDVAGDAGTSANEVASTNEVSRIISSVRPYFLTSALVMEAEAVAGLTTTQLADYAAMRIFAKTEPSRLEGSSASTILGILDAPIGSALPITLTEWDLGFLRTLYGRSDERFGVHNRSQMRRRLREELNADRN